jgi:hypothetical protein
MSGRRDYLLPLETSVAKGGRALVGHSNSMAIAMVEMRSGKWDDNEDDAE